MCVPSKYATDTCSFILPTGFLIWYKYNMYKSCISRLLLLVNFCVFGAGFYQARTSRHISNQFMKYYKPLIVR